MKNVQVKLTIGVIILVAGLIFLLQNRSPVIAIVIFGNQTVALPVGFWLILSAIAGLMISLLLQFLLGGFAPKARRPRDWDDEEEFEFPEDDQRERFTAENFSNQNTESQSDRSDPVNYTVGSAFDNSEEDWESPPEREDWNDIDDDWNIEEPPRENNNPQRDRDYDFYTLEKERENRIQPSSVSSYRYRGDPNPDSIANQPSFEPEEMISDRYNQQEDETDKPNSPQIYEANYRVIRPPLWNLPEDENEDDDEPDKR
ncbi:hypothetical protein PCC7418_0588 [Halothece sp. PCC 7418]|uniref:DUF308 domain-containing protein n=1 Tax=Halothece sp. (strain PCC 7418) TaxID=65093 RepID=UPI0002A05A72|nr:DUF308 domain-containing protein [Halothece sp. PCC 7418]AFZ42816.1 hypothetical protein PCC7418_0588 [Halothece sp. PCC 7418]